MRRVDIKDSIGVDLDASESDTLASFPIACTERAIVRLSVVVSKRALIDRPSEQARTNHDDVAVVYRTDGTCKSRCR